jgi:hypothetical protein
MNHPELLRELARQHRNDLLRDAAEYRRGRLPRSGRRGPGRAVASRAPAPAVGTLAMCA